MFLAAAMSASLLGCSDKNEGLRPGLDVDLEDLFNPTTEDNKIEVENETTGYPVTIPGEPGYSGPPNTTEKQTTETPTETVASKKLEEYFTAGSKNPTSRKEYEFSFAYYESYLEGKYTPEELIANGNACDVIEQKIEYTENGYKTISREDDTVYQKSKDIIYIYDSTGDIIKYSEIEYSKDYPDGLGFSRDYLYGTEIEYYSEDGEISYGGYIMDENDPLYDIIKKDNKVIVYGKTRIDVYDAELRESVNVIKNLSFKLYEYNEDGKVEKIYTCYSVSNGMYNGKYYDTIEEWVEEALGNDNIAKYVSEYSYDSNGNVMKINNIVVRNGITEQGDVIFYSYE